MIIKLKENDRERVMGILSDDPSSIFIIGDIENHGFDEDFQEVWEQTDPGGNTSSIILRYHCYTVVRAVDDDFDVVELGQHLNSLADISTVSGTERTVDRLIPHIKFRSVRRMDFLELLDFKPVSNGDGTVSINRVAPSDCPELVDLYNSMEELSELNRNLEEFSRAVEIGSARAVCIRRDGRIVSTASTAAENSMSGMLGGVCTLPDCRGRGYATRCVEEICGMMKESGKRLCLMFDNPTAGSIYARVGFRKIGRWAICLI